ncbi:hypothetical protein Ahy_A10g050427 [Arachis hypogaea]|uniref:Uncharacterized protein n=1 Tax=Arachis hypogaea TaxID=3818 RepID=A0A445B9B3_ARAHY|nr:hypothetical protein Ahy_A10g050427 [Arachis hypogaea]
MSNVAIAAHMKTEAITEHWFGEKLKEVIAVVDNIVMEMIGQRRREVATTVLNKSDLLSRFMGSIEDDNYSIKLLVLCEIRWKMGENNVVSKQRRSGTILSSIRVVKDYFVLC